MVFWACAGLPPTFAQFRAGQSADGMRIAQETLRDALLCVRHVWMLRKSGFDAGRSEVVFRHSGVRQVRAGQNADGMRMDLSGAVQLAAAEGKTVKVGALAPETDYEARRQGGSRCRDLLALL